MVTTSYVAGTISPKININQYDMAERVGFEPTVRFPAHTLSKRAP
jgi:hypothetical protein